MKYVKNGFSLFNLLRLACTQANGNGDTISIVQDPQTMWFTVRAGKFETQQSELVDKALENFCADYVESRED